MKPIVTLALCLGTALSLAAAKKPNILFIYTDDQSNRTVSSYKEAFDWVKTPNIDALAASGVRFEQAYIGSWCMASRATLLTGHYQHAVESMRMEGKYPGCVYDAQKCRFWPSVFRKNGYHTAQIGKWHTGVDSGFGRDWDYQIVWNRTKHVENAPNYYYDQVTEFHGGKPQVVKGYTTDNYTDWAVDYINGEGRDKSKPWYLWLCYGAVHGPFTPADRHIGHHKDVTVPIPKDVYPPRPGKPAYIQKMEHWVPKNGEPVEKKTRKEAPVGMKDMPGRPLREWIKQYHEGVLALDEAVGRLLQTLKDSGQDEDTLIVFTSDQGFGWGQHGFKSKVAGYDATIGCPLIIRPPASRSAKTAGKVVKLPVSGADLPPTFFAQAGLELPWEMHGKDLSPVIDNRDAQPCGPAFLVHTGKFYGSDTAIIPPKDSPDLYWGPGVPWYVMLAEGNYKYIRNLVGGEMEELYDLTQDPDELENLALCSTHKETLAILRKMAVAELRRTDAPFADNMPKASTE
jgi:arylsulfatase A-like enzyme